MPIPNQALILVADGRKTAVPAQSWRCRTQLDLRTEAHDERDDRKDREIKSDAPGSVRQSFGFGRPALDETDFHQQAEDRWAKDTADMLNRRALANDYDALAIVAPPRTLGELRKHFHKEVETTDRRDLQQGNDRPAARGHRGFAGRRGGAAGLKSAPSARARRVDHRHLVAAALPARALWRRMPAARALPKAKWL